MGLQLTRRGKAEVVRSLSTTYRELSKASHLFNAVVVFDAITLASQVDLIFTMTECGAEFHSAKAIAEKLCTRVDAVVVLCGVLGERGQSRRQQLTQRISLALFDAATSVDANRAEDLHELFMDRSVGAVEELAEIGLTEPICVGMAKCFNSYYHEVTEVLELRVSA